MEAKMEHNHKITGKKFLEGIKGNILQTKKLWSDFILYRSHLKEDPEKLDHLQTRPIR